MENRAEFNNIKYLAVRMEPFNFLAKVLLLITVASTSVMASTFVDIDKVQDHKFPEEVRELGIPVTLLHKHKHGHGSLVFSKDYKKSFYKNDVSNYNACSWCLGKNGKVIPYEYCEENILYDKEVVKQNLEDIRDTGYDIYGTTVRPINEFTELETDDGHIYVKEGKMDKIMIIYTMEMEDGRIYKREGKLSGISTSSSETVLGYGLKSHACVAINRCTYSGCTGHVKIRLHANKPGTKCRQSLKTGKALKVVDSPGQARCPYCYSSMRS